MKRNTLYAAVLFTLIIIFIAGNAFAIPAFARRYKISCSTCHAPFPKLKPYGADFAGNGFIITEEEKDRDYVSAGDDLLWLNKEFPLAVRFDAFAQYNKDSEVTNDLETPWGVKLLSGGALYKNIGYYFYFYMYEGGEVAGIEDAYIHFDNVFNTNLDIMVGQFQTSDPLMKRELRLTYDDYQIYRRTVGLTTTNLTYDRGIMMLYTIEKTGTDIVGMVVNGNGKVAAGEQGTMDNDNYKNFGIRLMQSVGNNLSIGGFYYQGKQKLFFDNTDHPESSMYPTYEQENKFTYIGPDLNATVGPIEITYQYLLRKDSNPEYYINEPQNKVETKGMVAEVIYSPKLDKSRYYLVGLYNKIESDYIGYIYETASVNVSYLLARNLKMLVEYTRDLEYEQNRFVIGLVSGF
ncbi:MAG TPA: hypothetical protein PLP19_17985 [bacterium]|nr:hypothetical protein [bacterium]HPN45386.1 hypothetical protein [bacterium]